MLISLGAYADTGVSLDVEIDPALESEIKMLRKDLRADKLEIVTENVRLTEREAEIFWPIYREYDARLREIWNRRITLIAVYASHYDDLSDEQASYLISESLKIDVSLTKMRKKYHGKIERAVSVKVAARFVQVERRINNLLEIQVAREVPFVE
jgi:hypothetical protein